MPSPGSFHHTYILLHVSKSWSCCPVAFVSKVIVVRWFQLDKLQTNFNKVCDTWTVDKLCNLSKEQQTIEGLTWNSWCQCTAWNVHNNSKFYLKMFITSMKIALLFHHRQKFIQCYTYIAIRFYHDALWFTNDLIQKDTQTVQKQFERTRGSAQSEFSIHTSPSS